MSTNHNHSDNATKFSSKMSEDMHYDQALWFYVKKKRDKTNKSYP